MNKVTKKQWLIIACVVVGLILIKVGLAEFYGSIQKANNDVETIPAKPAGQASQSAAQSNTAPALPTGDDANNVPNSSPVQGEAPKPVTTAGGESAQGDAAQNVETAKIETAKGETNTNGETAPAQSAANNPVTSNADDDAGCDIRKGCELPNGAILRIEGAVINTIKPFKMFVTNAPADTEKVYVSFSMTDMDMGFNRYKFIRDEDNPRNWTAASVLLPVCVVSRKDYLVDLTIGKKVYRIPLYAN